MDQRNFYGVGEKGLKVRSPEFALLPCWVSWMVAGRPVYSVSEKEVRFTIGTRALVMELAWNYTLKRNSLTG